MNPFEVLASAKLNLTLAVLGRREDGFHEIESRVVAVGLYDRLSFRAASGFQLRVKGTTKCAADETNLVHRAAHALARAAGRDFDVQIELTKVIPIGAGLGGGSSDAAATLKGLCGHWGLNWPLERLLSIAAGLGSDVPFFLDGRPAILRGRGEVLEPLEIRGDLWAAIVVPPYGLSTVDVYRRFDELGGAVRTPDPAHGTTAREIMARSFNDLEPAAFSFQPQLRELHQRLNADRFVRMSGSGSALFTLFDDEQEARRWSARVRDDGSGTVEVVPVLAKPLQMD